MVEGFVCSSLLTAHLFCHVNHGKPSAASGLLAFGLAAFGLAASRLTSSGLVSCCLVILVDCFGFGCGWCCGFAAAGCMASGFVVAGLAVAGFEALGCTTSSMAVVRLKQKQVHRTDAAETWQLPNSWNATLPNPMWGKPWVCLCHS